MSVLKFFFANLNEEYAWNPSILNKKFWIMPKCGVWDENLVVYSFAI